MSETNTVYVEDVSKNGTEWEEGQGCSMGVVIIKHVKAEGTPADVRERERKYVEELIKRAERQEEYERVHGKIED